MGLTKSRLSEWKKGLREAFDRFLGKSFKEEDIEGNLEDVLPHKFVEWFKKARSSIYIISGFLPPEIYLKEVEGTKPLDILLEKAGEGVQVKILTHGDPHEETLKYLSQRKLPAAFELRKLPFRPHLHLTLIDGGKILRLESPHDPDKKPYPLHNKILFGAYALAPHCELQFEMLWEEAEPLNLVLESPEE